MLSFIFLLCIQKRAPILRTILSGTDTMRVIRSKNEFFIFLLAIFFYFFSMVTITILIIFTMMVLVKTSSKDSIKAKYEKIRSFLYKRLIWLSFSDKIILWWSLLALISLFWEWIIFEDISHNSFHSLTGANGYLLFLLILALIGSTLSIHYKQKLKLYSGLSFNDYHLAIIVGILLIILPINSMVFIHGLATLSDTIHGNGIGLSITSGILVFTWALLKKKQLNDGDISLYMTPGEQKKLVHDATATRDNMKLPF